jgi:glucokinase
VFHSAEPVPAEAFLNYIVGIDLGGTNIVVGCVSEDGTKVRGLVTEPTRADLGPDGVVARMVELAGRSMEQLQLEEVGATVIGVGIGAPGPLDYHNGIVLLAPNLGWKEMPLRARISEGLGLPAALDNDANCAAIGEWWQGAAKGTQHALAVTIGTGIGGGVILNGKIYHGASDCAGELGHTTIDMDGRRCACGNYGCLEAYTSGPAIALRAAEAIQSGDESSLRARVGGDLSRITAQTVYDAAAEGDELALEVVRDTASYLGAGIANFLNIFNPEVVVVCGGVTAAGERLFVPMQREVARRAFKPAVAACRIVPGILPGSAGVLGAAKAFIEQRDEGLIA